MKRKLALLLAGTMVLSAVPATTIFATNGELRLTNAMVSTDEDTTTGTATIVIGDGVEILPVGASFGFTLENATLVAVDKATIGEPVTGGLSGIKAETGAKTAIRKGNNGIDVDSNVTGTAKETVQFTFQYKVIDEDKPAYATITNTNVNTFDGKTIQLTKPVGTKPVTGKVSKKATQTTLSLAEKGSVSISSDVKGAFKAGEVYSLVLPVGYEFATVAGGSAPKGTVTISGNDTDITPTASLYYNETTKLGNRSIAFKVPAGYDDTDNIFGSTFLIEGLEIINTEAKLGDVNVSIKKDNSEIANSAIATFTTYKVNGTIDSDETIPTIVAGQSDASDDIMYFNYNNTNDYDRLVLADDKNAFAKNSANNTATFTISESMANAFRGGDLVVTLPEGVEITGVEVEDNTSTGTLTPMKNGSNLDATGDNAASKDYVKNTTFVGNNADDYVAPVVYSNIDVVDNVVTFRNVQSNDVTRKFSYDVTLEIQTDANFSGDVVATLSSSTNSVDVVAPVEIGTIAKVESRVGLNTKSSEVLVGYTSQPASDIKIAEKVAGEFVEGEEFTLTLDDTVYGGSYGFNSAKVSAENAVVTYTVGTDSIEIVLEDIVDTTKPVTINVTDVKVWSNAAVPTYNAEGDAINLVITSDNSFEADSVFTRTQAEYIKFVNIINTENANSLYNQDVTVELGATQATLNDGTKVDLYGASYISADGNTMMPVKGTGYALGLQPEDIVYDSAAKMATFFLPGDKIAQITAGSSYAVVDGVKVPLLDAKGNLVSPVIKDGRFYLPLRAASKTVFGVDTEFDAATKAVTLNPTKDSTLTSK